MKHRQSHGGILGIPKRVVVAGAVNWLEFGQCVRIYDKNGNHVLSLLPCEDSPRSAYDYDLATPDGKVQLCGVNEGTVSTLVEIIDPIYWSKNVTQATGASAPVAFPFGVHECLMKQRSKSARDSAYRP